MHPHDPNATPPKLPGEGWKLIAGGHEPEPGKRYELAVEVGWGLDYFTDLCVSPRRFERIDYEAVVAFRPPPWWAGGAPPTRS
jgi:hypothetical protein